MPKSQPPSYVPKKGSRCSSSLLGPCSFAEIQSTPLHLFPHKQRGRSQFILAYTRLQRVAFLEPIYELGPVILKGSSTSGDDVDCLTHIQHCISMCAFLLDSRGVSNIC